MSQATSEEGPSFSLRLMTNPFMVRFDSTEVSFRAVPYWITLNSDGVKSPFGQAVSNGLVISRSLHVLKMSRNEHGFSR